MEELKVYEHVCEPDPRSFSLGLSLQREHERVAALQLHLGVPETIRSYFNTTCTLYVYGYFYYAFFSLVPFHAAGVAEMALRTIIPWTPANEKQEQRGDHRTLRELIGVAVERKLIRDDGFPRLIEAQARERELQAAFEKATGRSIPTNTTPFVERFARSLPLLRNTFAHQHSHTIMTPAIIFPLLEDSAALVNQLWEPTE
jgi:hypothetical protein